MLTLSKLSDYAIVLMSFLARHDEYRANAGTLSQATRIPMPTVVKLLKMLVAGGALQSIQGRGGGYRLGRLPGDISLSEIIESIEGPIAVTECNRETGDCRIQDECQVRPHWRVINQALRETLAAISLADLSSPGLQISASWQLEHTSTRQGRVEIAPAWLKTSP